jgi:SAM-dependent methyltransferase
MADPILDYDPSMFDARSEAEARQIIITGNDPKQAAWRWRKETPWFRADIARRLQIDRRAVVLDYGCGIGRIAKELIRFAGCRVIGVDISESMRRLALDYVADERFSAHSPEEFDRLIEAGERADGAYAVYVLQHCLAPASDLDRIKRALREGSRLYVANSILRWVPTSGRTWTPDDQDVWAYLAERFEAIEEWPLPERIAASKDVIAETRCRLYRRR